MVRWLKSEAEAQDAGVEPPRLQWEHDWTNSDQSKDRASGNKRHLFLTEEKQETKTSPLGDGAESLQTYLSRPCWCRFLLDQALLLIHLGRLAPSLWCWQGQASRT